MKNITEKLFELSDSAYRSFHSKLIPDVEKERIIGVRTPILRKFAKEFSKTAEKDRFLCLLPHKYYDENNLHAFIIEEIKDFDECAAAVDAFLPYIDNWATCDMMSPKVFKKNREKLLCKVKEWLASEHTYSVRFGICMLMKHFLSDCYSEEILPLVLSVHSEEYYIRMVKAWFLAEAMVFHYEDVLQVLENKVLDDFTHNKAIRKACESYRISAERKEALKKLVIKNI